MSKRDKIKNWFLNNLVSIITLLWPVIVLVVTVFVTKMQKAQIREVILAVGLVVETIVLIIFRIWNHVSYKAYRYPADKLTIDYEFTKKRIYYEVLADDKLRYSRTMTIRVLKGTKDCIMDQYLWTGKKEAILPTAGQHVRKIESCPLIGIWKTFRITFVSPVERNHELTYTYNWPLIESCKSSSPFVSVSTEEPTKEIEFSIKLGHLYSNKEVTIQEFRSIESPSDQPLSQVSLHFDEGGDLHHTIKNPKRFRYYRVLWTWEND